MFFLFEKILLACIHFLWRLLLHRILIMFLPMHMELILDLIDLFVFDAVGVL
jgi:hypothetical protein